MKALTRWSLVALAVLWAGQAQAQTADEVVEHYLTAIGGRAALSKLESRIEKGTLTVTTPMGDLVGALEIYNKAPNKFRSYTRIDLSQFNAGEIVVDQRCDGKTGYMINTAPGQTDREITGSQLQSMLNNTFPTPLTDYKSSGAKIELAGKDKVGERAANVILYTPKTGPAVKQYFDAETSLLVRTIASIEVPEAGGPVESTTDISDYREVDGVKTPFALHVVSSVQTVDIKLQSVEHNKPIDETMFSKPVK